MRSNYLFFLFLAACSRAPVADQTSQYSELLFRANIGPKESLKIRAQKQILLADAREEIDRRKELLLRFLERQMDPYGWKGAPIACDQKKLRAVALEENTVQLSLRMTPLLFGENFVVDCAEPARFHGETHFLYCKQQNALFELKYSIPIDMPLSEPPIATCTSLPHS